MDKLVKEETEKVQRSFDNQLALQAKQAAAPQVEPVVNEQNIKHRSRRNACVR